MLPQKIFRKLSNRQICIYLFIHSFIYANMHFLPFSHERCFKSLSGLKKTKQNVDSIICRNNTELIGFGVSVVCRNNTKRINFGMVVGPESPHRTYSEATGTVGIRMRFSVFAADERLRSTRMHLNFCHASVSAVSHCTCCSHFVTFFKYS